MSNTSPTPATMRAARELTDDLREKINAIIEQRTYVTDEWGGSKLANWQWQGHVLVGGWDDATEDILKELAAALAEAERGALTRAAEVARDYWKSNDSPPKGTTWIGDEIAAAIELLRDGEKG